MLVALDESRRLNNGEPAALAHWLDLLDLAAGACVLHIGCGVGYYTAIVAAAVSARGRVLGLEVDPGLAARAHANLRPYPNAMVVRGDGSGLATATFDAIFVNAGATHVPPGWIQALRPGGRLLIPLTVEIPGIDAGAGQMLLVTRQPNGHAARFAGPVGIYHCTGARSDAANQSLAEAYGRGDEASVRSLRSVAHPAGADCWLHSGDWCLSRMAP